MNPMKNFLSLMLSMGCTASICSAQPFVLVTEAEAAASIAAGGVITPRSVGQPGSLQIELIAPDISKAISAPTNIEVRFVGNPPSEPKPDTFRILYGAFRIDITQRLLGVAKVTKEGIKIQEAVLPKGRHQLSMSISDSMGRQSQQTVAFTVE
ncbi:hypothetical protein [Limnohabitans sp.]|uniref:hypothetical protein n=1 Tax=Limnohabitans sp. TaxID=1907725 RepID=UPI0033422908